MRMITNDCEDLCSYNVVLHVQLFLMYFMFVSCTIFVQSEICNIQSITNIKNILFRVKK